MDLVPRPQGKLFDTFSGLREGMLGIHEGITTPYDTNDTLSIKVSECQKSLEAHRQSLKDIEVFLNDLLKHLERRQST